MPTVSEFMDINGVSVACGYPVAHEVSTVEQLHEALQEARNNNVMRLIEVKCGIGSRKNLGRPTTTPKQNKEAFVEKLRNH